MIPVTQVKKGMTLKMEGELFKVVDVFHHTQGRGYAIVKLKLKSLKDGRQIEKRLQSGEKVEQAYLERVPMTYIYNDGDLYYFMNNETYEQVPIHREMIGDAVYFLKEDVVFEIEMHDGKPVGVIPPKTVDLEVVETEPYLKGATAAASNKPAVLETGLKISVPFFIEKGDVIKIDTEELKYIERVRQK